MFFRILIFIIVLGISSALLQFFSPLTGGFGIPQKEQKVFSDDITIGWVGDMVPAKDAEYNHAAFSFVGTELQKPDLMIGNLEGTFALEHRTSKCVYIATRCHAFRGDESFADALKNSGFDLVSLINNHSYDYGTDGLKDTLAILDARGIPYIAPTKPTTTLLVKGKRIGILGLSSTQPLQTINDYEFITTTITTLKAENDFVIVVFHGGTEGSDKTLVPGANEYMGTENRGNVELVAHTAIDAGADMVLGSGPHVLRKIETYKNKTIAYSLGNFVGGNGNLTTTGILGHSGIFTSTLSDQRPQQTNFISVLLTKNGTPTLDILDHGKKLIESLSQ